MNIWRPLEKLWTRYSAPIDSFSSLARTGYSCSEALDLKEGYFHNKVVLGDEHLASAGEAVDQVLRADRQFLQFGAHRVFLLGGFRSERGLLPQQGSPWR